MGSEGNKARQQGGALPLTRERYCLPPHSQKAPQVTRPGHLGTKTNPSVDASLRECAQVLGRPTNQIGFERLPGCGIEYHQHLGRHGRGSPTNKH